MLQFSLVRLVPLHLTSKVVTVVVDDAFFQRERFFLQLSCLSNFLVLFLLFNAFSAVIRFEILYPSLSISNNYFNSRQESFS